jgi:hypothetical protein
LVEQEVFLISFKQAMCGKFALQFSDEFVGNGSKAFSIVSTKDNNIIVGMVSHDKNIHDSKTLDAAITHANSNRTKPIQQAVCVPLKGFLR